MNRSPRRGAPRLVLVLATTALVVSSMAIGMAASATVATTRTVLAAAKSAIVKQTGVHLASTAKSTSSTTTTEKITADFGTTSGVESISQGKDFVTIKVTPTYAYFDGSSTGLTDIFGLNTTEVKKIGKDWVSLKAGTSEYTDLKSDATISSVSAALPAAKGTTLSTEVKNGAKLYVFKWTIAATSTAPKLVNTITVAATGATLPMEETSTASDGSEISTFSKWGEHISVSKPPTASTIAYSKVTS